MKKKTILALALSVLFFSCGRNENHKPTVAPAVKVSTIVAGESDVSQSQAFSGVVEESSATTLSFPVSGTLQSLSVSDGERVVKGQLIATLDKGSLKNSYDIAKAALDEAQDAYERMKMLHDSNSLPDMQWVEVQNTLKQAQSAEAIAARALKDAALYAPVSGYVAEKFAEPGMTVAPIQPIVKIVDINPIKVTFSIPEDEISDVKVGQEAHVYVKAANNARLSGKITEKGVTANPLSRAYEVKMRIDNPDGILLPGMVCDVTLDSATPHQAILLPLDAVLLDSDNQNFVWLKKDGTAHKRIVKVEGLTADALIISDGIAAGDSVIVAGQQKVSENTLVTE